MLRTAVLPALMVLLGVAIIVRTLAAGGGPIALGLLIGVLFVRRRRAAPLRGAPPVSPDRDRRAPSRR